MSTQRASRQRWESICEDCAGAIDSLVELLQGRFSKGVMERICRQSLGLFPSPAENQACLQLSGLGGDVQACSGRALRRGARFDHQPELLFRLREVDEKELIVNACKALPLAKQASAAGKVLGAEDLSDIFGLDMAQGTGAGPGPAKKRAAAKTAKKKAATNTAPGATHKARKSQGR